MYGTVDQVAVGHESMAIDSRHPTRRSQEVDSGRHHLLHL